MHRAVGAVGVLQAAGATVETLADIERALKAANAERRRLGLDSPRRKQKQASECNKMQQESRR